MVSSGSPSAGQSSSPSLDGVFMSAQQLLDLAQNQRFICALDKDPEMVLPLKLEVPFDQLVDIMLQEKEADRGIDSDIGISKKRRIKFKSPHPDKKVKQPIFGAKTPILNCGKCYNCGSRDDYAKECPEPLFCRYCKDSSHHISVCPILLSKKKVGPETSVAKPSTSSRKRCYNCGSSDHYVTKCPEPLYCRYCKGSGHYLSTCPTRPSKREGKLKASKETSLGQGIPYLILDFICLRLSDSSSF